ncbi:MAG: hypothetical protein ACKVOR_06320 [Flavobacteriales bacterium]
MKKQNNDPQLEHDLRRLSFDLHARYGVRRLGYFYDCLTQPNQKPVEVNIIVELEKPMGWKFFELKEFLERKLYRRIDMVTPNGIKVLFKPGVMNGVKWL